MKHVLGQCVINRGNSTGADSSALEAEEQKSSETPGDSLCDAPRARIPQAWANSFTSLQR